jgi:hypothetical protein
MTFIPFEESKKKKKKKKSQVEAPSTVEGFRTTELYKLIVKYNTSGNRRLVQSLLTGSNLMEADDQADEHEAKVAELMQGAVEATRDPFILDLLVKLVSAGLDRSLLDVQPGKKGTHQIIFTDKAERFKASIKDILATLAVVVNDEKDNGMMFMDVAMKEGHEPGSYAQEITNDLPDD